MKLSLLKPRWWSLLAVLLLQLIVNPCWHSEVRTPIDYVLVGLNCLVVVMILQRMAHHRLYLAVASLLGAPILILYWIPNTPALLFLLYLLTGLLYLYTIILGVPLLLKAKEAHIEQIAGALSLYLLIGITWAIAYSLVETVAPGSYHFDPSHIEKQTLDLADLVYFSFVTLTTLGYGDIVPTTCSARALAMLEAINGVTLLSFVVARLIGLSTAAMNQREKRP